MTMQFRAMLDYLELLAQESPDGASSRPGITPGKRSLTMNMPARPAALAAPVQRRQDPAMLAAAQNARAQWAAETARWMDAAVRPDLSSGPAPHDAEESTAAPLPADGAGRAMPAAVQAKMEHAFDTDFSSVRIHEGARSHSLGALAYTQGTDIHFAPGQYRPDSQSGQALLGHELTHVVQQSQGRVAATTQMKGVGVNDDAALEREADELGARAARGERVNSTGGTRAAARGTHTAGVQRASAVVQRTTEVENQSYGHGAFMGSAMDLLDDRRWRDILQVLMPDVYAAVMPHYEVVRNESNRENARKAAYKKLVSAMENNPVCAAYGTDQLKQLDDNAGPGEKNDRLARIQGIEWDVFLPQDELGKLLDPKNANKPIQQRQWAHDMVNKMLIAHGKPTQLGLQTVFGWNRQASVANTAKTTQGGVRPDAWMDLFGRAIRLANGEDPTSMENEDRVTGSGHACDENTFRDKMPFGEVIQLYEQVYGAGNRFKVILDIKSPGVTPAVLNFLTRELNSRGVLVHAIGSFDRQVNEQSGLDQGQNVNGDDLPGPQQIIFLHGAGDLAKRGRTIRENDQYLFNGASLIDQKSTPPTIKQKYIDLLVDKREQFGNLQYGVYAQETDISPAAFTVLAQYVNERPDLFVLGFAWGGPSDYGERESPLTGKGWGGQDWLRSTINDPGEDTDERTKADLRTRRNGFQPM